MKYLRFTLGVLAVVALAVMAYGHLDAAPKPLPNVDMERTNQVRLFEVPEPGTDELHFTVWDTIEIPNVGTDTVELQGRYVIERKQPTTRDWTTAAMDIDLLAMDVEGDSDVLGPVTVRLNGVNHGHVAPTLAANDTKDCTVSGYVMITLHDLDVTVFNKEGVPLSHGITHIPPIGQGGSSPQMRVPLYDVANPDAEPVAYLNRVRTQIGGYIG